MHNVLGRFVAEEMHDPVLEQIESVDLMEQLEPPRTSFCVAARCAAAVVDRVAVAIDENSAGFSTRKISANTSAR